MSRHESYGAVSQNSQKEMYNNGASGSTGQEYGGVSRNEDSLFKMNEGLKIPVTSETAEILKTGDFADIIREKFDCTVVVHSTAVTDPLSPKLKQTVFQPEKRYEKKLPKGLQISVWKDDLTTHKVDAVVNAANEDLRHYAGLAKALEDVGGPVISRECKDIIKKMTKVDTGDAVVTNAGNLPCLKVIHAVGPFWKMNMTQEEERKTMFQLAKATKSILEKAVESKMKSVAIPAVSSGLFNFPLKLCADIIVDSILRFHEHDLQTSCPLKEIRLVNHDDSTVSEMEQSCIKRLGNSDNKMKSYSEMVTSTQAPKNTIKVNNLLLYLKKGNIEVETTHAIVNTISNKAELRLGQVSSAILTKAGHKLQECITILRGGRVLNDGEIVKTGGFNLNCIYVYHAVCAYWSESRGKKVLQDIVKRVLMQAEKDGISSIALPAIGTGTLDFPRWEVANIMMEEVIKYAESNKKCSLQVFFVLFPGDTETITEFEKEMCKAQEKYRTKISYARTASNDDNYDFGFHKQVKYEADEADSIGPVIELCGADREALEEAKAWVENTILPELSHLNIDNNHIFYLGRKEHEVLCGIQNEYGVSLLETVTDTGAHLEIKSSSSRVLSAVLAIEKLLCSVQKKSALKHEEALLQSLVQWVYTDEKNETRDYDSKANMIIEKAFLKHENWVHVEVKDIKHHINITLKKATDDNKDQFAIERQCCLDYVKGLPEDWKSTDPFYQKLRLQPSDQIFEKKMQMFQKEGLKILKLEKIQNPLLEANFLVKKQLSRGKVLSNNSGCQLLYQRVPAQFCNLVCRSGFQKTYSQPNEQKCGAGLYFSSNLKSLMEDQTKYFECDQLIYIFEAEVFVGRYCMGSQELIVPPAIDSDGLKLHDSVVDGLRSPKTYVIFNSSQAWPRYLVTCRKITSKMI